MHDGRPNNATMPDAAHGSSFFASDPDAPSLIALGAWRNDRVHGFAQPCAFPEQVPIGVLA